MCYIILIYIIFIYIILGKPEGKRPLRRPRRRWEDNIKMDIQEVGTYIIFIYIILGKPEG